MYIYGLNVCLERLKSTSPINAAIIREKFDDKTILDIIRQRNIKCIIKPKYELDKLVDGLNQGIILDIPNYKTYSIDEIKNIQKKYPLILMLDHLEDPHNFGAIIRTSEALGVDLIIIPNDRSVDINGTVVKTSAGTIENIKIVKVTNLVETIKYLKKNNYWIIGTDMNQTSFNEIDYKMPVCLIIGNEGKGMSRLVKEECDFIASIDMYGSANSLNASVATGIMLYKIIDKRK